jgi:hypothetical protein
MNSLDANSVPPVPAAPVKAPRYTAQQWDQVRGAFCSSILADTSLNSLAQNLEGQAWPLTGPSEVPSAYLDLSWSELRESLALRGQPPAVADLLLSILEETLAFDAPFGDMLAPSKTASVEENPVVKNLAKLKIDSAFPVALSALSADTQVFCQLENIKTVGELALAAQRMAGAVIVGGDFRALLNALSNIDEAEIARYLPFRPGTTGVHYLEGLAQAVRAQPAAVRAALLLRVRFPQSAAEAALARTVTPERLAQAREALLLHGAAVRGFCAEDYAELQRELYAGVLPRRLVAVLGDPAVEAVVAELIAPQATGAAQGFWKRFLTWWRS